jgi:tetratricopeptide (TPR) repeat protein
MELNVEVNTPPSMWAYHLLGQAYVANNEIEKAIAGYKKILELDPQDQFAKRQLDSLRGDKP